MNGMIARGGDGRYVFDLTFIAPALVLAAIFFNFFLCFINTNVFKISATEVILCEMLIVGGSIAYGFYRIDRYKLFWIGLLSLQVLIICALSIARQEVLMKPLRDVMIMPVFVILGLSAFRVEFTRILLGVSAFIVVVALFEGFAVREFLQVFNFKNYFVAKGAMEDLEWLKYDTFASGMRPQGRFLFDLPGVHRVSSIFLEPVSLGFYGFVAGLYFVAARDHMRRAFFYAGLALSFFIIWFSDARMAFGCLVIALLARGLFVRTDHRFSLLIFPLFFLICWLVNAYEVLDITGEGMGARIHSTMDVLSEVNLSILLGLSKVSYSADSGLADLLQYQGVLGVLLFWIAPIVFMRRLPEAARVYIFGLSVYLSFGFILSPAIFSIKTAALLWFSYGYLVARHAIWREEEEEERQEDEQDIPAPASTADYPKASV